MGDLDPLRLKRLRQRDHGFQAAKVLAVYNDFDREGDIPLTYQGGDLQFMGMSARTGKLVRQTLIGILQAELDMFEAGVVEREQPLCSQPKPRSNHVDVEVRGSSGRDELFEIRPRQWFTTGQVKMQH